MRNPALLLAAALGLSAAGADAAPTPAAPSVPDAAAFEHQPSMDAGSVVIALPNDGQYVYRSQAQVPAAAGQPAFMMGHPPRQDFKYLSQEEQVSLWKYREERRVALINAATHEAEVRAALAAAATRELAYQLRTSPATPTPHQQHINWPRVVIRGDETCVPVLAFSEAADWRDHLTCTTKGGDDVQ